MRGSVFAVVMGLGWMALACGGTVEVVDDEDEAVDEEEEEADEPEPEPEPASEPSDDEVIAGLKATKVKVGDLHLSCHEYLPAEDKAKSLAKWIGGMKKIADTAEIDCSASGDAHNCKLSLMRNGKDPEFAVFVSFDFADAAVDTDSLRCVWAG